MRKLLFKLHLYVALAAGIFVVILGVSGSVMAFEPEIDHILHWKLTYVTPGPRTLSLAEISDVVTRAFPGEPPGAYVISPSRNISYQVATRKRTVFINQYSGEILGDSTGPDAVARIQGMIHQLHLRLLIRNRADTGGLIESCAGLAIVFLSLSGLYLWWPLKRIRIDWHRRVWFDLHNVIGILSFAFLLILATTGCVIGFDHITTPLFYKITGSTPPPRPRMTSAPHAPDAKPISPDQVVEIARTALPGAAPFVIEVPAPKGVYFIRARYPEDLTPGGRSQIFIDQYTGNVLFAQGSRTAPAGARMVILNRAIHTGDIFGVPSKMLMSLASLAVVVQLLTGLVMWWKHRGSIY